MTEEEKQFVDRDRVTYLNNVARECAHSVIFRAGLCDKDRNTVLRAVIGRLNDAIAAIHAARVS